MNKQPVPKLSPAILERVLRREFPNCPYENVFQIVSRYKSDDWKENGVRVQVACVKNASGNITELERQIESANWDFRDVLLEAEYPQCRKQMFQDLTKAQKSEIYGSDWEQYQSWIGEDLEYK